MKPAKAGWTLMLLLLVLFFNPEDGGDIFLRNGG
jgi:hypothetical protein